MSRRTRTAATGVSLFPFLDVLICTMGSLILLLIVVTKKVQPAIAEKARQAAITAKLDASEDNIAVATPVAEEIKEAPVEQPKDDNSLNEWRTQIETLTSEHDSRQAQLTELERKLSAVEAATKHAQAQAASKNEKLKITREAQRQAEAERERLMAEVTSAREELTTTEQRLVDAKERQRTARSKFAFVPFDGRTGTTRRPILLECTETYIRFLPEDIRLTPAQLNGFTTGFNPLLNASRELIHYWDVYDRVHADEAATEADDAANKDRGNSGNAGKEPYVLLLVRSNGAMSFMIAKHLLTQLKIPHGYELLDDDMELEFSEPNPVAKLICQQAITQTLDEREKVKQLVAANRDLQRDQLKLEPHSPSFVPIEPDEPPKIGTGSRSFTERSASDKGVPGRGVSDQKVASASGTSTRSSHEGKNDPGTSAGTGFGDSGNGGDQPYGGSAGFGPSSSSAGRGSGYELSNSSSAGNGNGGGRLSGNENSSNSSNSSGNSNRGSGNSNGGTASGIGRDGSSVTDNGTSKRPFDNRVMKGGRRPEADFLRGDNDQASTGNATGLSEKSAGPQSQSTGQHSKSTGPNRGNGRSGDSDVGDEPLEETLPQSASASTFANDDTKPFPLGRSNRTAGTTRGNSTRASGGTSDNAASDKAVAKTSGSANGTSNSTASGAAGSSSRQKFGSNGGTSSNSTASNSPDPSGSNARSGNSSGTDRSASGQRSSGSGDLRHHKRRYNASRGGIGLEKAISIRVWSNRIMIGEEFEIPVDAQARTESLVDRVLIGLDQVQASWPSAGVGYHWVPTLRYEVVPGGDQVQQRLNSALMELGLVSNVTYLDADPDVAAKPKSSVSPKKSGASNSEQTTPSREPSRARAAVSMGTRTPIGGDR